MTDIGSKVTFKEQGYDCTGIVVKINNIDLIIRITEVSGTVEQMLGGTIGTNKLPSGLVTKNYFEVK
jgi:hypothetical protein